MQSVFFFFIFRYNICSTYLLSNTYIANSSLNAHSIAWKSSWKVSVSIVRYLSENQYDGYILVAFCIVTFNDKPPTEGLIFHMFKWLE